MEGVRRGKPEKLRFWLFHNFHYYIAMKRKSGQLQNAISRKRLVENFCKRHFFNPLALWYQAIGVAGLVLFFKDSCHSKGECRVTNHSKDEQDQLLCSELKWNHENRQVLVKVWIRVIRVYGKWLELYTFALVFGWNIDYFMQFFVAFLPHAFSRDKRQKRNAFSREKKCGKSEV